MNFKGHTSVSVLHVGNGTYNHRDNVLGLVTSLWSVEGLAGDIAYEGSNHRRSST